MGDEVREQIARLAYEIYEKSGRAAGRDLQNWLAAEKTVLASRAAGDDRGRGSRRRVTAARKKK